MNRTPSDQGPFHDFAPHVWYNVTVGRHAHTAQAAVAVPGWKP